MPTLDDTGLDLLFRAARTYKGWQERAVDGATLQRLYELARMPPTSANTQPMRLVFVASADGKARLKPCLDGGNVAQTMAAPVTAIVAYDAEFYTKSARLFPAWPAIQDLYAGLPEPEQFRLALQGGSLQGAYLMLAARALGLDCGPMNGFDRAKVDAEFLAGTAWQSNFLLNLGYGDPAKLYPRGPRLAFDEACQVV
ncbi:MAG: malonic semialdehyde reductase [Myxococcales bacterium]|nr:malonic semialdehyde reductase [Myxococcales bacterium]